MCASTFLSCLGCNSDTIEVTHLMCIILWLGWYIYSCAIITAISFRIFSTPQKETLHSSAATSQFLHPSSSKQPFICHLHIFAYFEHFT